MALLTAVGKRKRGEPLPDGYVVVRASEDVVPQGTLPACVHLVTMLTRAATMHDPLAVVPFKAGASMALMTEAALVMRRAVASSLTLQKITDLRRAIDPTQPNFELMQQLYDAGLQQCAVSGVPVFNPSAWTTEQRHAIWQVYVCVAAASDGKEGTERALVAALDKLRGMAAAREVAEDGPA